ncbi:DUF3413 domain-containing protein [Pseudaeromonas paramecii]|uniref:DUF3413 domain-containing protein n=1 Tax=Pseudaeromonas paramecii TaxID=2138166 RepID=A0ABP8Q4Q8_9GAMM
MLSLGNINRDSLSRLISWGHWFTFFNILLALVLASRYVFANPWPETTLGVAYLLVSWVGHFGFIGFLIFLLTLFPLSFLIQNQRWLRLSAVFIATCVMTLLLIDTQIYKEFKFHINPVIWEILFQQAQSKAELNWSLLFVCVPLFFSVELLLSYYGWKMQFRRRPKNLGKSLAGIFVICFLLNHLTHIWADANLYAPITEQKANFPLSYPMTARSFLAKHGWLDLDAYRQAQKNRPDVDHHQSVRYPLAPLEVAMPQSHYNLLLVVVRDLRADLLNNIDMPNLARYASQHQLFTNHLAGDNDTASSLFSLFYGLPGQYQPLFAHERVPPALLDELQRQDYLISAFAGHDMAHSGYQHTLFAGLRLDADERSPSHSQTDAQTLHQWQTWLAQQTGPRPWFSYVEMGTPQTLALPAEFKGPYQPESAQANWSRPQNEQAAASLRNRYKNAVFYVDQLLGELFDRLASQGLSNNTVVVITSDHGVELGDNQGPFWGAGQRYAPAQLQVPLVLAWPGMAANRLDYPTRHQDLAATLLGRLLGVVSDPQDYSIGTDLLSAERPDWALLGNTHRYVVYDSHTITEFNRQGDFSIRDRTNYRPQADAKPNMAMLVRVMNQLKRFTTAP